MKPSDKATWPDVEPDVNLDPRRPGDLLFLLAAAAMRATPRLDENTEEYATAADAEEVSACVARVAAHLDELLSEPGDPPDASWLSSCSTASLASRALRAVEVSDDWADPLRTKLDAALSNVRTQLDGRRNSWLIAGRSARMRERFGPDCLPWSMFLGGGAATWLAEAARRPPEEVAVDAWCDGDLDAADSETLRGALSDDPVLRAAYRSRVLDQLDPVEIGWDADDGSPVASVPVPHVTDDATIEVLASSTGTRWQLPWRDIPVELASDDDPGPLGEQMLSPLAVRVIDGRTRAALETLDHLLRLRSIPSGRPDSTTHRDATFAAVAHLRSAGVRAVLSAAQETFERGLLNSAAPPELHQILELRMLLEEADISWDDMDLTLEICHLDEELRHFGPAFLLLKHDDYEALVEDHHPDHDAWWGVGLALDRGAPAADVEEALRRHLAASAEQHAPREHNDAADADTRPEPYRPSLGDLDRVRRMRELLNQAPPPREVVPQHWSADRGQRIGIADDRRPDDGNDDNRPCRWLEHGLLQTMLRAVREPPESRGGFFEDNQRSMGMVEDRVVPGRVALLLAFPGESVGTVVELRLTHNPNGPWTPDTWLGQRAYDGIRRAFFAVSRLTADGQPRYPLREHGMQLIAPKRGLAGLEGESLALPLAIAMASLWSDTPLPPDFAATGRLIDTPNAVAIAPVASVLDKSRGLGGHWGAAESRPRLFVHPDNACEVDPRAASAVPVATLVEALEALAINLSQVRYEQPVGVAARLAELNRLVQDVQDQNLHEFANRMGGTDPWMLLGDRMRALVSSLATERGVLPSQLDNGRVQAALALTHAGDHRAADLVLEPIGDGPETPVWIRAHRNIVALGVAIDDEDFDHCGRLSATLDSEAEELQGEHRELLLGRIRGTQGRAWMHARQLDPAISLLQTAVDLHGSSLNIGERGRSRIYLAAALRLAGRLDAAEEELLRSLEDLLGDETRPNERSYQRQTLVFHQYEAARLALAQGRTDVAIEAAQRALVETQYYGPWPKIGVLRTLAQAQRAAGDEAAAEQTVQRLRAACEEAPWDAEFYVRFLSEAQGSYRTDGEIY